MQAEKKGEGITKIVFRIFSKIFNAIVGGVEKKQAGDELDPLFEDAARLIVTTQTAWTTTLQRRYSIGYNRAAKIMDQLEAAGIVGPAHGENSRQVLYDSFQLEKLFSAKKTKRKKRCGI